MYFDQFFYLILVSMVFKNIKVRIPIKPVTYLHYFPTKTTCWTKTIIELGWKIMQKYKKKNQKMGKEIKCFQHKKTFNSNYGSVVLSRVIVPVLSDKI